MTASAKTVPGAADHDICMIAPTVPGRKGLLQGLLQGPLKGLMRTGVHRAGG